MGKFEMYTDKGGQYRFRLKAGNGQVIGSSQMYADTSGMENGIKSVATNAPDATVEDNS